MEVRTKGKGTEERREGREGRGRVIKISLMKKIKEKVVKVGGRVEWRRGTKETKNKRKCLNLIPSALEYTCFPEAVLFGSQLGSPEDSSQVKSPCSDCPDRRGEVMTLLPLRWFPGTFILFRSSDF